MDEAAAFHVIFKVAVLLNSFDRIVACRGNWTIRLGGVPIGWGRDGGPQAFGLSGGEPPDIQAPARN